MADRRGKSRLASLLGGCVIIVCGAAILAGLVAAAGRDDSADAWQGRTLGFVMSGVAVAVGVAMIVLSKPGQPHYSYMVGSLVLAALLTGAYSYKPKAPQFGDRAEAIPINIGDWAGSSSPVDENTMRVLGTKDIIMRTYTRGGDVVVLAVIFVEGARRGPHPPEHCYSSDGFEMDDIASDSFTAKDGRTIDVKRLHIVKGGDNQFVLYWYKAGDLTTPNFLRQYI